MSSLNLQTNSWYQIQVKSYFAEQSLDGTSLYDHGLGAVFMQDTNTSHTEQNWQFFPVNDSYVLRTQGAGPIGYLIVAVGNTTTIGSTVPEMANDTLAAAAGDGSMYWKITPWGDGTFYLTNNANGTDWHLSVLDNSLLSMSSNITAPQDGQSFSFNSVGTIDDVRFSSVITPTATSTPTNTQSSPTSTSPSTHSPTSKSNGLSTGASAGIGAGVGVVALIALVLLGFWFMRRRKRRTQRGTDTAIAPNDGLEVTKEHTESRDKYRYSELPAPHNRSVEMAAYPGASELEGNTPNHDGRDR